jgi:hypothetical protein
MSIVLHSQFTFRKKDNSYFPLFKIRSTNYGNRYIDTLTKFRFSIIFMISNGLAPIVKLYVNKNGEFMSGMIYSIKQVGEGGPIIDTENSVIKEI